LTAIESLTKTCMTIKIVENKWKKFNPQKKERVQRGTRHRLLHEGFQLILWNKHALPFLAFCLVGTLTLPPHAHAMLSFSFLLIPSFSSSLSKIPSHQFLQLLLRFDYDYDYCYYAMTTSIGISLYPPFLFSIVFPAMIKLFKRNTSTDTCHHHHHYHHHPLLGLELATTDIHRPPNVLESAMLRPNSNPPQPKKTQIGFLDDDVVCTVSGGLASCTENLGFESSDQINSNCMDEDVIDDEEDEEVFRRRKTVRAEGRGKVRTFPPPLSSLNRNGKPSFYLRPVRKDGRLELTEVRIERAEILHAWRENGRLTLRLVSDLEEEEMMEEEEDEEEEKRIEEENVGEWRLRGVGGSSEGLRRCHEMVNHHHHHHVHGSMRMCGISIVWGLEDTWHGSLKGKIECRCSEWMIWTLEFALRKLAEERCWMCIERKHACMRWCLVAGKRHCSEVHTHCNYFNCVLYS